MGLPEVRTLPGDGHRIGAFVHITFDNCFTVTDLKIIQGLYGLFVAMPNKKRKDGTFEDVAFPANAETRKIIEDRIFAGYRKVVGKTVRPQVV